MGIFNNISNDVVIVCYDEAFNIMGFVDEFKSFSWNTSYSGIGTFTITLNSKSSKSMNVLRQSTFIVAHNIPSRVFDKRTKQPVVSGIITEIQHAYKPSGDTFTVKGNELKGIAKRRIILNVIDYSSDLSYNMMKDILNDNLTNPSATNRKISGAVLVNSTSTTTGEAPDIYTNVGEALTELAEAAELGWSANIDTDATTGEYGITWAIYDGYDRTGNDSSIDPLYLSFDNDTLETANYKINMDSLQNFAYIGGQGEGTARTITSVYDTEDIPTGLHRYETFVDARNESTTAGLQSKGKEALAEYESTDTIKLTPSWMLLRRFGSDFYVGDLFKFTELDSTMRLTESTLTYEGNSITCELTFGYKADDFKSAMRIMLRNYKNIVAM